jgi:hypothetical protein
MQRASISSAVLSGWDENYSPLFVIPAKAGIHHQRSSFSRWALCKIDPQVMDSRLRGNDEG